MNGPFASFNPNTTRWVPANALALANAALLAYSDAAPIQQQVGAWGFDPNRFVFLESKSDHPMLDTQGFVACSDDAIVISFRGTQPDSAKDWLTDMDVILRPFIAGRIHLGFYDALDAVWDDLLAALDKYRTNAQSLWVTGHSLGAALACVCVARLLLEERRPVNNLYTFGQPRTGDVDFANRFDAEFGDKTFRFVNDCDIVTRLYPRVLGFSHADQMMFFDDKAVLHDDDHFWNKFLMEVEVGLDVLRDPPDTIKEHSMDLYVANMAKNLSFAVT